MIRIYLSLYNSLCEHLNIIVNLTERVSSQYYKLPRYQSTAYLLPTHIERIFLRIYLFMHLAYSYLLCNGNISCLAGKITNMT